MTLTTIIFFVLAALAALSFVLFYFTFYVRPKLVVLMYHRAGPVSQNSEAHFFVEAEEFEKQLNFLKENNYTVLGLEEAQDLLINRKPLPRKAVLLTFDDGWEDNYTVAFPLLKKAGLKAGIFLSAAQISNPDMLTETQIKEMHGSGVIAFASHGMNHKRLRSLSDEEALYEMAESKKLIEEKLQKECLSFCYPFGAVDRRIRRLCFKAGYKIDFGTRKGVNFWPWSAAPLKRAHMLRGQTLEDFQKILTFGRTF